jgi:hypothetical protein
MIVTGFHVFGEYTLFNIIGEYLAENNMGKHQLDRYNDVEVMQFTGHSFKGKDVYESDIFRVEESADGLDPDDAMNYYVVTWIKEWCMFSLLRIGGEYEEYLESGADHLDTESFWTFPLDLEETEHSKLFLCGNIHETSKLLDNKTESHE